MKFDSALEMFYEIVGFYKTHTLVETCRKFEISPGHKIRNLLSKVHRKSGHGGKRKDAGRPKKLED